MLFDVHAWIPVRVKYPNIEAETPAKAIAAVEANAALSEETTRLINRAKIETSNIETIEIDDGSPSPNWLVDCVGDEDYANSVSFTLHETGKLIQNCYSQSDLEPITPYQRAVLDSYADGDFSHFIAECKNKGQLELATQNCGDTLLSFILRELNDVECGSNGMEEAVRRMNNALADIEIAITNIEKVED